MTDESVERRLVLDVGNTAAKGALFDGEVMARAFALPEDPAQWNAALARECRDVRVQRAGLACVVPQRSDAAREALRHLTNAPPLAVAPDLHLPLALDLETPETFGADRLAAAVAGHVRYGGAGCGVLVIDAGTALTYEAVDAGGVLRGGAIAPGPELLRRALHDGTAQLPAVPLEQPPSPVGRSTREAMQSGLLYGLFDSVSGMVERVRTVLPDPVVVATGGWGALLGEHVAAIHHVDPHLVLRGVRELIAVNEAETSR